MAHTSANRVSARIRIGHPTPWDMRVREGSTHKAMYMDPKDEATRAALGDCPKGEPVDVQAAWRSFTESAPYLKRSSDRATFLALCRTFVQLRLIWRKLDAEGYWDSDGVPHPLTQRENQLTDRMLKFAAKFGLTPVDYARMYPSYGRLDGNTRNKLDHILEGPDA